MHNPTMSAVIHLPQKAVFAMVALALVTFVGCATPQPEGVSFRDLDYPYETRFLDIDGIDIAIAEKGRGDRTLILIHGLGSSMPVWSQNMDALAAHHRVIAVDLPGFGRSSKANYHYSMAFFAQVIDRVITATQAENPTLVGHSMGGQIALTHALMFPGRAQRLVLIAPAGLETFRKGEGRWLSKAVTKDFIKATPPDAVERNVIANFYDMPDSAQFLVTDRIRVMGGPDFDAYAYANSRCVTAMIQGPVFDRLGEIKVKTLVLF
ncbi:MAG: alpha/beta fold hydrolase, partial [Myxococcota bacterium]